MMSTNNASSHYIKPCRSRAVVQRLRNAVFLVPYRTLAAGSSQKR